MSGVQTCALPIWLARATWPSANQVPYIAFRSLSDLAGGSDTQDVGAFFGSGLAEANASAVTLAFLEAWKAQQGAKP